MSQLEMLRRQYESQGVVESDLNVNPFRQFKLWYDDANATCTADWFEPNAMSLATADPSGYVTNRTVLLKHFDEDGFTFFTNYISEKGQQIAANPRVCLLLHWPFQARQIRIDGTARKTSRDVSQKYFHSRPRGAQIGACVSQQSAVAPPREELDRQCQLLAERLKDLPVPIPETWGGYVVTPDRFEFWQGRVDRIHDRFRYQRDASNQWRLERLYP